MGAPGLIPLRSIAPLQGHKIDAKTSKNAKT